MRLTLTDVEIPYGGGTVTWPIPDGVSVDTVGRFDAGNIDEQDILCRAIAAPLDAPLFGDFLTGAHSPLVIVNDHTRSTPTGMMLAPLLPALSSYTNWRVLVATGLHRKPSDNELKRMFGDTLDTVRDRLHVHDGRDRQALDKVSGADGPIRLNRAVLKSDRLVVLTSVEPHFFAGYTGGRKSLIPGLAGAETIERSHAGAVCADSAPLRISGNPVRRFIDANTEFIAPDNTWAVQVVLDKNDRIANAFAGCIDKTFAQACPSARKRYAASVETPYDVVLSLVRPPLDANLYQAQKGWELSTAGVRDGGVMIVAAACPEGVGSPFYENLSRTFPDQASWLSLENQEYKMGLHKLVRIARARDRFRLMAVTAMPPETVTRFGYEPYSSVEDALDIALGHVGRPARVLIVDDGALTTLICEEY